MKQRWLPEFAYPDVDEPGFDQPCLSVGDQAGESAATSCCRAQCELFTAERELIGQIEAAFGERRFEDACGYSGRVAGLEGPRRTPRLGVLNAVGDVGFWDRPSPMCERRRTLDQHLVSASVLRVHPGGRAVPACEAAWPRSRSFVRASHAPGSDKSTVCDYPDGTGRFRSKQRRWCVMRSLEGFDGRSRGFADGRLVDLLAEDHRPVWLACLGAVRHLWPVPRRVRPSWRNRQTRTPKTRTNGAPILACLRHTVSCGRDDPAAVEARRRHEAAAPRHARAIHAVRACDGNDVLLRTESTRRKYRGLNAAAARSRCSVGRCSKNEIPASVPDVALLQKPRRRRVRRPADLPDAR